MTETRILDLKRNVHDLCADFPELPDLLAELGFTDIVKPGMRSTAGRFMTIPMGAQMRHIDLAAIVKRLESAGFTITGM